MDWLKRLFGIKTNFEIMLEHIDRTHGRDMELIRAQMNTLDKVVAIRYDRPTYAPEQRSELVHAPVLSADQLVDVDTSDDEWLERQA